jgi:two-component system, sensor histidine kinase FlrB
MDSEMPTDEPVILKFPTAQEPLLPRAGDPLELQSILAAWTEATDRLQRTHETLQAEVRRLSDELEAKNRELARKNRLADLGQMAAHVAHEVRNSLVPMKLYLSLLRRRIVGDDGSLDVLEKIVTGFTALEATVGDLLHFSSQRDAHFGTLRVAELLEDVLESLAPQLSAQGIHAEIDCPANCFIAADGDMLRRAVLNLILNALDAQPAGGEILLTACRTSAGLEIEVADGGPGVPEPLLDRLFEPFFSTKSSGTGLGLAIVERIAAAHGGRATVVNCPEGGAAFTLVIPQTTFALEKAA